MCWRVLLKTTVLCFLLRLAAHASLPFQSASGQHGYVSKEHYLGCLWNFRAQITLCPGSVDGSWQRGNRYSNVTSKKALNSPEDQLLTGMQCFQALVLAHELQEKFLSFYTGVPRQSHAPPIEEVMWITSLTEMEQEEMLQVCPGMLVTSLFLHAELRFSLNSHDLLGQHYRGRALRVLRQMKAGNDTYELDHYRVTMRTWPVSAANAHSLQVRRMSGRETSAETKRVDLVIVACRSDLTWVDALPLMPSLRILMIAKCKEAAESPLCQRSDCIPAWHIDVQDPAEGAVHSDECGGYVYHILRHYHELAEWTIFLQDDAPRHLHLGYLNLVLKMISSGTLSALAPRLFLHLNNDRHLMYWTPCLAQITDLLGLPSSQLFASYCCSQFLVHKSRILARSLEFYQAAQELLTKRLSALEGCLRIPQLGPLKPPKPTGHRSAFQIRPCHLYEFLWHVVFGCDPVLPRREDDESLPSNLRFTLDDDTLLPLPDFSMMLYAHAPR
ncbi:unnamed protein product [Symbiodinium sp. CCMP2592]|nr:unnamed protein product [Symbiodinium sp. CCMP2592]